MSSAFKNWILCEVGILTHISCDKLKKACILNTKPGQVHPFINFICISVYQIKILLAPLCPLRFGQCAELFMISTKQLDWGDDISIFWNRIWMDYVFI